MNLLHRQHRLLSLTALFCLLVLAGCATTGESASVAMPANYYPTVDRVIYVQECVRTHPGPHFEMLNKCSCAVDALAGAVSYDDFVTMSTVVNALSIGGERGGTLRDNETIKPQIKRYRDLEAKVHQACFINDAR